MSLDSDEAFWPGTNGDHQQLYRGYKRLIYAISERLRRQEVLSLVYQYDLPTWYIEVGPTYEQGHALRVLAQMESMQIFSPTNLRELGQALEALGRADLAKTVGEFEGDYQTVTVLYSLFFTVHSLFFILYCSLFIITSLLFFFFFYCSLFVTFTVLFFFSLNDSRAKCKEPTVAEQECTVG